jgi:limonene-1,2-epoxide hydrolase
MELYGDDVECIEPAHAHNQGTKGKAEVFERLKGWYANVEAMHESSLTEPVVMGNHFSVGSMIDMTMKGAGRMKMEEVGVFEVKDGKIVKEQFFY